MGVTTRIISDPEEAGAMVRSGLLVAFPTETVYGLGASIRIPGTAERIFSAKGRPADNPLIVHVPRVEEVTPLVSDVPLQAARFMEAFWPGPLSIVMHRSGAVPDAVTAGLGTVAVRIPDHPTARAFLEAAGVPVAAPSANRSGRPSPTTWEAVRDDLDGRIEAILKGDSSRVGLESTVVDCTGPHPVLLRRGSIGLADLQSIEPTTRLAGGRELENGRSPGVRHPHYRPVGQVTLARPNATLPPGSAWLGLQAPAHAASTSRVEVVPSIDDYARRLFAYFRTCEKEGIRAIFCEDIRQDAPVSAIHAALMDRLERACS